MTRIAIPDLIVLLPGITGSVLERAGQEIWSPDPRVMVQQLHSQGKQLASLGVTDDDWKAEDLGDGVEATHLMPDIHLVPGLWKIDGYSEIESFLINTFDLTKDLNYFPFPYDWRRDNRASALRLRDDCHRWLKIWRDRSGNQSARIVLIAHSMGGLVARYFVEALEGWRDTRAVITFGTPFYGSLNAVNFLLNGYTKRFGPFEVNMSNMLRSLTSVHQLVPSYRCVYLADGAEPVTPAKANLPGWQASWSTHLDAFQVEVEAAANNNRADPAFSDAPVTYWPLVGTDQPTLQSATVCGGKVQIIRKRGNVDEGGDGTVPLLSAALAGTEVQRTFAPQRHARLQNYTPMLDHLKGLLSTLYEPRISDLRAAVTSWLSLAVDDVYLPDEPLSIELGLASAYDTELLPEVEATVAVTDHSTGSPCLQVPVRASRDPERVVLDSLPSGNYVIEVTGRGGVAPVSDVVVVIPGDAATA